jgi:cell volume regulation protein A
VPAEDFEETEQAQYYGSFTLSAEATLGDIAEVYGVPVPESLRARTLAQYMDWRFRGRTVVGDSVRLGPMELVVRELEGPKITKVGVRITDRRGRS